MNRFITLLFLSLCNSLFGQVIIVRDSLLKNPIENVTFHFEGSGAVSEKDGRIDLGLFDDNDMVKISHISYRNKTIAKKNIGDVVYLTQKTTMLPSVILTQALKTPVSKKYPIFTIKPVGISRMESSTASLLFSNSAIVIQESQSGGGSPNYRGMEANRLLLIVDGIPLNNAIYRSGHLQSSATINPFFIKSVNLLSGPASVSYGNGAMGGALIFNTLMPKKENTFHLHQQFESSSNSVISSFQTNYHKNKLSNITSFSIRSSGNLNMGSNRTHGYSDWGRQATKDKEQLYTKYNQADFMHKSKYEINSKNYLLLNTQYSISSNIYRFDKMNDVQNNSPKYEKWYYGPQIRFFQSFFINQKLSSIICDNMKTSLAFQNIKESRHYQKTGESVLNNRAENVKIYDFNLDFTKSINSVQFAYGAGSRFQRISSKASLTQNDLILYNTTRYPENGSSMQELFAYSQINLPIYKKLDLLLGLRWNQSWLQANFNNPLFQNLKNYNSSIVKSALFSFKHIKKTIINLAYYSGFRNPNIDDIGKIFSKDDVNVVVPNENLQPEYADNIELSIKSRVGALNLQLQLFNTQISNAITRSYGSLNNIDSILYDGTIMKIQMNQNIERASIKGVSLYTNFSFNETLLISASCNYLKGKSSENKPLAHIPPFNAKLKVDYNIKRQTFRISTNYNGWKLASEYDEAGVDNLEEATNEGNPSWYTLNLAHIYKITPQLALSFAIKNILDTHYKTFGSGLSASGRNFIISLGADF